MPAFGKVSKKRKLSVDTKLQKILDAAIEIFDFSIICGHRNKEAQDLAFATGKSKKKWPESTHNKYPSQAVDIAPYPIDWENRDRFIFLAGIIYCISQQLGIKIRFGGNWSRSWQFENQKFDDLVHFELVENTGN